MPRRSVVSDAESLEELAVDTLKEVMSNSMYAPETRIAAAEKALRALGKAEPAKTTSPQVVFNFGDHLTKAMLGMNEAVTLMKPALPAGTDDL